MNVPPDRVPNESELDPVGVGSEPDLEDALPARSNPFSDTDVKGLFFPGARREESCQELLHLFRYGPPLIVVYGEAGVGKRYLMEYSFGQADPEIFKIAVIDAEMTESVADFLEALVDPWQIKRPINRDNYHQLVGEAARSADAESQTLLAIVQSAQVMDSETCLIVALLLAATKGLPVKLVLVADCVDFRQLDTVQGLLDHMPNHYLMHLEPLSSEQVREYLAYRMQVSGYGEVFFNNDQIDYIVSEAAGNLKRVNEAAQQVLDDTLPAPVSRLETYSEAFKLGARLAPTFHVPSLHGLPWLHIGAVAIILVLVLGLLLSNLGGEPEVVAPSEPMPVAQSAKQEGRSQPLTKQAGTKELLKPDASKTNEAVFEFSEPTVEQTKVEQTKVEQAEAKVNAPKVVSPPSEPKPGVKAQEPAAPSTAESPKVAAEPKQPVSVDKRPAPQEISKQQDETSERERWILGLSPDHYVMQILSAKEMSTVSRFLAQYPSLQKVAYYKTDRNGAPWFVVVQGDYASRDAAQSALLKFPASLQKQNPWIRKVEDIQKELEN